MARRIASARANGAPPHTVVCGASARPPCLRVQSPSAVSDLDGGVVEPTTAMTKLCRTLPAVFVLWVLALLWTDPALAKPDSPTNQARLDSTVRYLQDSQLPDGGFGYAGEEPSQDFSAWVTFALAAAGINPQDQAQPGGLDAYSFLVEHFQRGVSEELCAPIVCTTTFERELLVVDASGTNPHDFAGIDLIGEILARELPNGSFPFVPGGNGEINDTVWAILALSPIDEPAVQEAVQHAANWLIGQQESDGSWSWQNKSSPGEVDTTGAAIEALNAAGMHNTEAQEKAFTYLHGAQEPDGGFPELPGEGEANVASTAWATQGIWSAGQNPETWATHSGDETEEPLGYLASLQQPDGHIRWKQSQEMNGVWMTAMVAPAFAGQALPIPPVPRTVQSTPTPASSGSATAPAPGTAEPGLGGESSQPGSGVIAGGGGDGAPLFSRPQPQSKGKTPGGMRSFSGTHGTSATKHRRNPGPRRKASVPSTTTPTSEPSANHDRGGSGSASEGIDGDGQAGEPEVKGVLIDAPIGTHSKDALAPGLHSAGTGGNQTPWLAIDIVGAIALLALAGTQLERRRPQVIL
jgi:prenyltransferase beta subunit